MKTNIHVLLLFLALTWLNSQTLSAQEGEPIYTLSTLSQPADVPHFDVVLFNTASEYGELSRLNIRLLFNNNELQFITTRDKKFQADYEVSVVILRQDSSEVESTKWKGFVKAKNFNETKSKVIVHSARGFLDLPPSEYLFRVGLKDLETRRTGYREGTVRVRPYDKDRFSVSDIWFVDSLAVNHKLANSHPSVNVDSPKKLFAIFEIYNIPETDSVEVKYTIVDQDGQVRGAGKEWVAGRGKVTRHRIEVLEEHQVNESYRMKLDVYRNGDSVTLEQPVSCNCTRPLPKIRNVSDAIEKLLYIAKDDELKKMKKAEREEQLNLFQEFWKVRDPTPTTEENEYFIEYYSRIARANKLFKDQSAEAGWKTEMGKVYVMLGPPDEIQKAYSRSRSFDPSFTGNNLLVWQYFTLHRRVIFSNRFGEYRIENYHEIFDLLNGEMYF